VEVDVLQDRDALHVVEGDVVEIDPALNVVELDGIGFVLDARLRIEHLEDALAARHGPLEHRVLEYEVTNRVEKARHVNREGRQRAESGRGVQVTCAQGDQASND